MNQLPITIGNQWQALQAAVLPLSLGHPQIHLSVTVNTLRRTLKYHYGRGETAHLNGPPLCAVVHLPPPTLSLSQTWLKLKVCSVPTSVATEAARLPAFSPVTASGSIAAGSQERGP